MEYVHQLQQIELALQACTDETEKQELLNLKNDIQELVNLTNDSSRDAPSNNESKNDPLADEYALFMQEMEKEGAMETRDDNKSNDSSELLKEINDLPGKKCSAPFKFEWGDVEYYNAMISSVTNTELNNIEVRVMFINPIHEKMLPCPYFLETDCKFSEDKCKYSHGEKVLYSSLRDYTEPNFEDLVVGSKVLAKQNDKIWRRAVITHLYDCKCTVKFESNVKEIEIDLEDVVPLGGNSEDSGSESENDSDIIDNEDIINMSLLNTPTNNAIGGWEAHTKGIGSKLMQKMGYIIGTGLGKQGEGRIEPVTALILPQGKSLDYCMNLREKAGGSEDFFNADRRRKRHKRFAKQSANVYNKEKQKTDVFSFINNKLKKAEGNDIELSKREHRREIKQETSKSLNVASLKVDEEIKQCEREIWKINESLSRHTDKTSKVNKDLSIKLQCKHQELNLLKDKATNINHEQKIRHDKKKLTIF